MCCEKILNGKIVSIKNVAFSACLLVLHSAVLSDFQD